MFAFMQRDSKSSQPEADRSDTARQAVGHASITRRDSFLIRMADAAQITGLPISLIRKSFMSEVRRPPNVPGPPPHKRIGRAIYILADRLEDWVAGLEEPKRRRRSIRKEPESKD
jgi:hypothetical protein